MPEITLFDLSSKPKNFCWSYNPWKTRLQLNYKGINYKTEWLEYPEVAPKFKSLGLEPNPQDVNPTPYSIPTVIFHSDNKAIMDSKAIAEEIEKRYPTPTLPIDTPTREKLGENFKVVAGSLVPELVARVPRVLLNPTSREYFERTRAERFGMPLEEYEKKEGGEQAWDKAEKGLEAIAGMLKEKGGPFLDGSQVSFADFQVVGLLRFMEILHQSLYERITKTYPEFGKLYDASKQWLERDNH
ncbi:putative glutathione S-transferase [Viridothelium virens]|uniref:Putative glutathione S-transferase n=1 Tax=Viridothelium virens TaxID=1048519 RepID=A0A6A6H6L2_VIRVR|nr:putative glutathione S-transferase [Viridothelium virens]